MTTKMTAPARAADSSTPRLPVGGPHSKRAVATTGLALLLVLAGCSQEKAAQSEAASPGNLAPHKGRELIGAEGNGLEPLTRIPEDAPVSNEAREKLRAFIEAMVQPPQDATSDIHDEWFHRTTAMRERLMADDEHVGNAALHAFCGDASDSYDARRALLMIGAHAAPDSAGPLFHELTFNYGYRIEDRSEACLLLGLVDPEGYMKAAREFLKRRGRKTQTMPEDEFLLTAWLTACEQSGESPVEVCADVATNLWMQPFARYKALTALGKHTSNPLARRALETCLIESTGDGMLRQKAAQAIRDGYPREDGCSLFEEVLLKEVSVNFRKFLVDMISANCGDRDE